MTKPRFLRSDTVRHLRLGKKRRKLQKWRKARGRHSKIRRKHTGYPAQPGIGYKQSAKIAGRIKGKHTVHIISVKDLHALPKDTAIILSRRLGAKKRLAVLKRAQEMHLTVINANGGMHEAR